MHERTPVDESVAALSAIDSNAGRETPQDLACFECDGPASTVWRDHTFIHGVGASAVEVTARIPVRVCRSCGFEFLDHEAETLQHEAVCRHLGVLSPKEVRGIRALHGMSRVAFAKVTGLGEATLNRWENGLLIQNRANDRYLRVLASSANLQALQRMEDAGASETPETAGVSRFRMLDESAARGRRRTPFRLVA